MRKIFLLGMLIVGLNSFAQGSGTWKGDNLDLPQTTEKEYNYLTKGMKIQRESGLDVIAGYEFKNEERVIIDNKYVFTFSDFIEKSTGNLKAVSVVIRSGITHNTYYLCIPVNSTFYTVNYENFLNSFLPGLAKAYTKALSKRYLDLSLKTNQK